MSARSAILTGIVWAAYAATLAPAAAADPGPPTPPPGYVQCNDQLIPADPRIDVQNPLGAVMYRWFLQQMCAPGTPPGPFPENTSRRLQ